jgi:anaerobic magnesium-protoporphyrin IX monomethyl ester cyclase
LILLMTTAPPSNAPWYLGRRLPPLGLMYVAANLEKHGFQVQMLDNYLQKKTTDEVKQTVAQLNPEIVGITCGSATYRRCVETAKAIKEVLPNCKIVVGGWHASYMPDSLLEHPEIDYVVMGEGEGAMAELTAHIMKNAEKRLASNIAGVGLNLNGKIVKSPPKFMSNMDEIPFPARHLLPLEQYDRTMDFLNVEPVDVMNIARGCSFNCGFCETKKLWGNVCRGFSPQRVVAEMQDLATRYHSKGIYFINDNFTLRKQVTIELCDLIIKSKLDLEWVCDTRADLVNQELLEKMQSAGCKAIWFGVESGSQRVLDKINRHLTLEQIEKTFKLCKKVGLKTACSFMLGMPGETIADLNASYKFAQKLDADWCQFNIFIAYPDSAMYQEMLRDKTYEQLDDYLLSYKSDELDFKKLLAIQRKFHHDFGRSPRRVMRKIRKEGPLSVLKQGFSLISSKPQKENAESKEWQA